MTVHTCRMGGYERTPCEACRSMYWPVKYDDWRDTLMGKVTIDGLKYEVRSSAMGKDTLTAWYCARCEVLHVDLERATEHVCLPRAWLDSLNLGAFESDEIVRPNRNASIAEQYEALSIMFAKLADREMKK